MIRTTRILILALITSLLVASCGSTKVYTADKTVVYRDAIYNVSNVSVFTRKAEVVISDDNMINLSNTDKSGFNDLLDQHDGEVFVRQTFLMDDEAMVYQALNVDSWSDYNRMNKKFEGAAEDLQKFLADKKKTQLKLK